MDDLIRLRRKAVRYQLGAVVCVGLAVPLNIAAVRLEGFHAWNAVALLLAPVSLYCLWRST